MSKRIQGGESAVSCSVPLSVDTVQRLIPHRRTVSVLDAYLGTSEQSTFRSRTFNLTNTPDSHALARRDPLPHNQDIVLEKVRPM